MKRSSIIILVCMCALLCISTTSFAAPVGNPINISTPQGNGFSKSRSVAMALDLYEAESGRSPIKFGFDVDIVMDKDLSSESSVTAPDIDGTWYMGKVSLTCYKRLEPYITLGVADLTTSWTEAGNTVKIKGSPSFAYGGGTKIMLWEWPKWNLKLMSDAQYRASNVDIDSVDVSPTATTTHEFDVQEWQAAIALSKEIALKMGKKPFLFVPYAGIKYSDSDIQASTANGSATLSLYGASNDNIVGCFVGCDLMSSTDSSVALNVEGRFIDETAVNVGGTVRF